MSDTTNTWVMFSTFLWLCLVLPALTLPTVPEWMDSALERYLGTYLRRQNEKRGITDPEIYMDVPETVRSRGYPIEIHEVFTEDGYGLTLHRINGRKSVHQLSPRPVVFLQHGIICSSACWLVNTVDKSLAYVLADQGYDVWLGNLRGSTYSQKHFKYDVKDNEYWNFSWDQMGQYDIPAMLQFVLGHTHQKDLTYLGYSLGCTVFWVFADTRPELQSLVNVMIGLGPVSVLPNMRSPVRYFAPYVSQLEFLFKVLGTNEFLPSSNKVRFAEQFFCSKNDDKPRKCENFVFLLTGSDPASFNTTLLPVINAHMPAGTSVRTVTQLAQGVNSKRFCRYDWGRAGNQVHYGQDTPPDYKLENVKVPVILFYGENDWMTGPEDSKVLASRLGNLKDIIRVPMDDFNHLDFVYGRHVDVLVNNDVRQLISSYNPLPPLQ